MKILSNWELLVEEIKNKPGRVLIIGGSDSGKTFLANYLIKKLSSDRYKVALIDSDIGQSFVGPPTTIGLSEFKRLKNGHLIQKERALFFVGDTSPAKQKLAVLAGLAKLADLASENDYKFEIYDTCGLVQGAIGLELKFRKIELIEPDYLIILERESELDRHFLSVRQNRKIKAFKLKISEKVKARNYQRRKEYRIKKFREYFKSLHTHNININDFGLYDCSHPRDLDLDPKKGTLLGLNDYNDITKSLGIVEKFDRKNGRLTFSSPLKSLSKVVLLIFSDYQAELDLSQDK